MTSRLPLALAAGLVLALGIAGVTAWSAQSDEPGSAFVAGGDGAESLVTDARAAGYDVRRLVAGPVALDADPDHEPGRTLLVLVGAARPYTADETAAVEAFLEAGGRLLVADNFGHANSLTGPLGMTFERVRLVEPDADVLPVRLGRSPLEMWTPTPTALRPAPDVAFDALATSTNASFLDRDGDGIIGAGDPPGPFLVAASFPVGEAGGRVVVVADTAPFLSAGAARPENRDLRAALLATLLPEGGRVVVDESRTGTPDPWLLSAATVVGATASDPWRYAALGLALLVLALGVWLAPRDHWGPHRFSVDYFVRRVRGNGRNGKQKLDAPGPPSGGASRIRWTGRGRAAAFGGTALAVAGLAAASPQATYAAAFLLGAAALAFLAPPVRVRTARTLSADRTEEGSAVTVDLALSAQGGRQNHAEVLDTVPREFALARGDNWFEIRVDARATIGVAYDLEAGLRGAYAVGPLRIRSMDAFRLRTFETAAAERSPLLVRPRRDGLDRVPFRSKRAVVTLGGHQVRRTGDGSEFHSLRQYQPGDSFRIVNWKASARSRELVVNQRVHESMATIAVFVDAREVSGAGVARSSPLNEACRVALGIVGAALRSRDRVRVFAYGDGLRELNPPGTPADVEEEVATDLADLRPTGSTGFLDAVHASLPDLPARSPAVLVSSLEGDPTIPAGLQELQLRGLVPFAVALDVGVRPAAPEDGPPEPDADALEAERERTVAELRGAGVPVVTAVPGVPWSVLFRTGVI